MPASPNKLSQFWQELKRRNVVRVITVYAGAAFVIIELINNITEPLRLPEWTPTLVIVLLAIGFPIVIIFSWIYDIHPEGGIVKTEPADMVKAEDLPKSSSGWKIASYISFVVIVGLIILNIVPRNKRSDVKEILDKSIAVLPFTSLSDDPEKQYLADGVMEDILLNLTRIEDLKVIPSTSVQQYRNTEKTVNEICQELGVSNLLQGTFQKYGDQAKLIVQLIKPGLNNQVWARDYNRDWTDIFSVQSEVAQSIAEELSAYISPEERKSIEKQPTTNITAYELYLKGNDEYRKVSGFNINYDDLNKAQNYFENAIKYDSTYALAYLGLAKVYAWKARIKSFNQVLLDSAFIFSNTAISIDPELSVAYAVRGICNYYSGQKNKAERDLQHAEELDPNEWYVYFALGDINYRNDFLASIMNFHKAIDLIRGEGIIQILQPLAMVYNFAGFREKSSALFSQILELSEDSARYYRFVGSTEWQFGNYKSAIDYYMKSLILEPDNLSAHMYIAVSYLNLGEKEQSLKYIQRYLSLNDDLINDNEAQRFGYIYWVNGIIDTANYFFNKQLEYSLGDIESNNINASQDYYSYYDAAGIYSLQGKTKEAFEFLRIFNQRKMEAKWMVTLINNDPLFDNIRDEPEFQQIVRDVEAKYQAEHERVRQWLEEADLKQKNIFKQVSPPNLN